MKKKILCVSNSAWNFFNYRLHVLELLKDEYTIHLAAPYDHYTGKLPFAFSSIYLNPKNKNFVFEILTVFSLFRAIRRIRPDVIIFYTIKPSAYGPPLARLLRIPCIAIITGLGSGFTSRGWTSAIVFCILRSSLRFTQYSVYHNRADARFFSWKGGESRSKQIVHPGSGVDTDYFCPKKTDDTDFFSFSNKSSAQYSSTKHNSRPFIFLFCGRLLRYKGICELSECIADLVRQGYHTELHILGAVECSNPSALHPHDLAAITALPGITHWPRTDDVRPFLRAADCIVLPTGYREGLPRAILEASSCGKPVITTRISGCRHAVIDGVTGLLFRSGDWPALRECCLTMYHMPEEKRNAMGAAGRKFVMDKFNVHIVADSYRRMIKGCINGRGRGNENF